MDHILYLAHSGAPQETMTLDRLCHDLENYGYEFEAYAVGWARMVNWLHLEPSIAVAMSLEPVKSISWIILDTRGHIPESVDFLIDSIPSDVVAQIIVAAPQEGYTYRGNRDVNVIVPGKKFTCCQIAEIIVGAPPSSSS